MAKAKHSTGKRCLFCEEEIDLGETYLTDRGIYHHVRCVHQRNGMQILQALQDWALAVRRNAPRCPSLREYWTSDLDGTRYYNCFCASCDCAYLKSLDAGKDEGTDREWCGLCLYA